MKALIECDNYLGIVGREASEFFLTGEGGTTTTARESVSSDTWRGGLMGLMGVCWEASAIGERERERG